MGMDSRDQVWKRVWILEAGSEKVTGKLHIWIWSRIRGVGEPSLTPPPNIPRSNSPRISICVTFELSWKEQVIFCIYTFTEWNIFPKYCLHAVKLWITRNRTEIGIKRTVFKSELSTISSQFFWKFHVKTSSTKVWKCYVWNNTCVDCW